MSRNATTPAEERLVVFRRPDALRRFEQLQCLAKQSRNHVGAWSTHKLPPRSCPAGRARRRARSRRASLASSRRSIGDAQRTGYVEEVHPRGRVFIPRRLGTTNSPGRAAGRAQRPPRSLFEILATRAQPSVGRPLLACIGVATLRAVSKE